MNKSKVSLAKCNEIWSYDAIYQAAENLLRPLGGMEAFVKPGQSVMLKPNIVMPAKKESGCTTHPLLVKAIAVMAMKAGASKVVIADGPGVGFDVQESFEVSGMQAVADELGIEMIPTNQKTDVYPLPNHPTVKEVRVGRAVMEADVLINIPVMKTHIATFVTLCQKNLKGCLARSSMKALHVGGIQFGLTSLSDLIKPELNIIDGTLGQEGMGPMIGGPKEGNCLIASADAFACDVVGCRVMGIDPHIVNYLECGNKYYGYSLEMEDYELVGDPFEKVYNPFMQPPAGIDDRFNVHICEKDTCTGCTAALMTALDLLEKQDRISILDDCTICMGQQGKLPEEGEKCNKYKILIGNCMSKYRDQADLFIPGCSPQYWVIVGGLLRFKGLEELDEFAKTRYEVYTQNQSGDGNYMKYNQDTIRRC